MKKDAIKVISIFIILILPFVVLSALLGDIDGNGKVGSTDYILVRKHLLNTSKLTGDKLKRADVNSDGKVNTKDYIAIRKTILDGGSIATSKPSDNLEAYFLNTYNRKGFSETFSGNDAFIFKTSNGKYILIDTGNKSEDIKNVIYSELKKLQGKKTVTIDYMIISHMHSDHYGNAIDIMNDANITINKLVLKGEKYSVSDEALVDAAMKNNIPVVNTDSEFKEGSYYNLSDSIKMYFFNVKDIYKASDNCERREYVTSFSANIGAPLYGKSTNNKYIYFEGKDYVKNGNKVKINTRNDLVESIGKDYRINSRFYLTMYGEGEKRTPCSSNANSLAVLFQIKTSNGNKYMYIPSDLENNGYDPLGEYDSKYKTTIHGYGPTFFYEYKEENGEIKYVIKDNHLLESTKTTPVKRASSYETALNMKNKFSDLVGNITIYQLAHHGLNNYKEVIDLLKLNSKSVNAISPGKSSPKNTKMFSTATGAYYLRSTNMFYDGGESKKGTKCTIKANGTTSCAYY